MILTIVLVVMFALAFHMTFNHFHSFFERSPFTNMVQSTWKTMTMTTGEMGYEDIFHQASGGSDDNIPPIPFPEISYILWVIFLILMPILFTNLLVWMLANNCAMLAFFCKSRSAFCMSHMGMPDHKQILGWSPRFGIG